MDFRYTFEIDDPDVKAIFSVANGFSLTDAIVDSVVNGSQTSTVYITMPYVRVSVGSMTTGLIMNDNVMSYEYSTYSAAGLHLHRQRRSCGLRNPSERQGREW